MARTIAEYLLHLASSTAAFDFHHDASEAAVRNTMESFGLSAAQIEILETRHKPTIEKEIQKELEELGPAAKAGKVQKLTEILASYVHGRNNPNNP